MFLVYYSVRLLSPLWIDEPFKHMYSICNSELGRGNAKCRDQGRLNTRTGIWLLQKRRYLRQRAAFLGEAAPLGACVERARERGWVLGGDLDGGGGERPESAKMSPQPRRPGSEVGGLGLPVVDLGSCRQHSSHGVTPAVVIRSLSGYRREAQGGAQNSSSEDQVADCPGSSRFECASGASESLRPRFRVAR